jgi:hypothetical protein
MTGILDAITGKTARDAENQRQSMQRKSLADLAAQQAELDQGSATSPSRKRGRRLLTFLGGTGQSTLG